MAWGAAARGGRNKGPMVEKPKCDDKAKEQKTSSFPKTRVFELRQITHAKEEKSVLLLFDLAPFAAKSKGSSL